MTFRPSNERGRGRCGMKIRSAW